MTGNRIFRDDDSGCPQEWRVDHKASFVTVNDEAIAAIAIECAGEGGIETGIVQLDLG